MRSYMGSRSQEQASRSSKHTIRNLFCGLRHCSIISQFAAYGIAHKNRSVQGFLTSKNRFLTREEASELVRNNNQEMVVDRSAIREQLYSEDLY